MSFCLTSASTERAGTGVPHDRKSSPFRKPSDVTTVQKSSVFVSYSHHDRELISDVVRFLKALKHLVFLDFDDIEAGRKWRPQVESSLEHARLVVVFWCIHSRASHEVRKEYRAAIDANKDLVPVLLDETPLPDDLGEFHGVDLRDVVRHRNKESRSRSLRYPMAALAAGLLLAAATSLFVLSDEPVSGTSVSQARILAFTVEPANISSGEEVIISWSTEGAESVSISPAIGPVDRSGSRTITIHDPALVSIEAIDRSGRRIFESLPVSVDGEVVTYPPVFADEVPSSAILLLTLLGAVALGLAAVFFRFAYRRKSAQRAQQAAEKLASELAMRAGP